MSEPADLAVTVIVEQLRRKVPGGIGTYCRGLLAGLDALPPAARPRTTAFSTRVPAPLLTRAWDRGIALGAPGRGADVVHATSFAMPPRSPERPLVVTVHDLAWRRFPEAYPDRGREWHENALRRAAREAAAFVVPSELTAADLLEVGLGVTGDQVHVVAEGLDHLPPPDAGAAAEHLERLGIEPGAGYLLSVGTLEPRKNLARLVAAYELALPALPEPWPLLIVGPSGWGDAAPFSLARGDDGRPGVIPVGRVGPAALSALYRDARCIAYVPLIEGFGLPAGEAMTFGTPVVASAGMPSTGEAAVAVDPMDVDSIAAGLVLAAAGGAPGEGTEDDRLACRRRLSEGGRRWARSLTWERAAAGHVDVWSSVA